MTAERNAPTQYDIVIAGAGMAGASLACALIDSGLKIALIDSRAPVLDSPELPVDQFDARVTAITPASQEILERLGVWEMIRERRVSPYTSMQVWEADGTARISFSADEVHAQSLGHIVENSIIVQALHQRLHAATSVDFIAPATVQGFNYLPDEDGGDSLLVRLDDGRRLQSRLLVAADGGRSQLRKMAGFSLREWDYEHQAVVTTVRTEKPHQQIARQRFSDDGVLAFLPLHSPAGSEAQRYCSIVWSLRPERAQEVMALSDSDCALALQHAIEASLGQIEHCSERYSFPLRQAHAKDYVKDNVVLIGDAAHSIHPLAGQGANLGLLDAWVLAAEIREARQAGRCWYEGRVLRRYQRRRKGHNLTMMATMEAFRRLYADQPLPLRWLRNVGMHSVDRLPLLKQHIMREAMALDRLDS